MEIVGQDKPSLEELTHYGKKGMRWGHRKNNAKNPNYHPATRAKDLRERGPGSVKRINRRMNAGKTYKQASRRETARDIVIKSLVAAGVASAKHVYDNRQPIAMAMANEKYLREGRKAAEETARASSSENLKVRKPNRKGVYKITTL